MNKEEYETYLNTSKIVIWETIYDDHFKITKHPDYFMLNKHINGGEVEDLLEEENKVVVFYQNKTVEHNYNPMMSM